MTTRNLTATWLQRRTQRGDTRADALRWLNAQCGTKYINSRLNEWLQGKCQPTRKARVAMLADILPDDLSHRAEDLT